MEQGKIPIKKHDISNHFHYRITTYEAMEHKNNNPNDQETGRKYLNLMFIF
jgi:hypothetical protein